MTPVTIAAIVVSVTALGVGAYLVVRARPAIDAGNRVSGTVDRAAALADRGVAWAEGMFNTYSRSTL